MKVPFQIRSVFPGVLFLVLAGLGFSAPVEAQEMRIYTRVFNMLPVATTTATEKSSDRPVVILRSLTLFHAGKVYDSLESLNEFTVYEPAHRKFTVVSENRGIAAELTQDEIRRFLQLAEEEAGKKLRDMADLRVRMNSPFFRYDVDCVEAPTTMVAEQYLRFADWTAQLNSVLHPQSFLPGPRLALNAELREQKWLPVKVDLRVEGEIPLQLRAEHEIQWELTARDRQHIAHWEQILKGRGVKLLPFREYQRLQLSGNSTAKR